MNKLCWLMMIITVVFFLSIFLLDTFYLSYRVLNISQEISDKLVPIYQGHDRQVSFVSRFDNINLVYIRLKNPGIRNVDAFYFQIKDRSNNILRQIDLSGRNISEDDFIKFQFLPLNNIKNQTLNLSLNSVTLDQNKSVLAYTDKNDRLTYKIYSSENWFDVLREQSINFYQRFIKDSLFATAYMTICISTIIGYLWLKKVERK